MREICAEKALDFSVPSQNSLCGRAGYFFARSRERSGNFSRGAGNSCRRRKAERIRSLASPGACRSFARSLRKPRPEPVEGRSSLCGRSSALIIPRAPPTGFRWLLSWFRASSQVSKARTGACRRSRRRFIRHARQKGIPVVQGVSGPTMGGTPNGPCWRPRRALGRLVLLQRRRGARACLRFTLVWLRVAVAAAALLIVLRARPADADVRRRIWVAFFGMGLLNNVLPFALIVWGQHRIASGLAVHPQRHDAPVHRAGRPFADPR